MNATKRETRKAVQLAKEAKDLLYRKRCSRFWNDYRGQKSKIHCLSCDPKIRAYLI